MEHWDHSGLATVFAYQTKTEMLNYQNHFVNLLFLPCQKIIVHCVHPDFLCPSGGAACEDVWQNRLRQKESVHVRFSPLSPVVKLISRMNSIGALGEATGKKKVEKPSDIPGLRRKKAKKVKKGQNVVFIVDLQSSRSARTPKRKSAKKVESRFLILILNALLSVFKHLDFRISPLLV